MYFFFSLSLPLPFSSHSLCHCFSALCFQCFPSFVSQTSTAAIKRTLEKVCEVYGRGKNSLDPTFFLLCLLKLSLTAFLSKGQ